MIEIMKKAQRDESVARLDKAVPGCWINLIGPTEDEVRQVVAETGVQKQHITAALDEDERPHFDKETKDTLIVFRVPVETPEESELRIRTMPIGIIITEDHFITVHLSSAKLFKDFFEGSIREFYTTKKTRFLIQILSRTNSYFLKYLNRIENDIDRIEKGLMKSLKNEEVIKLFELQKALIYFQTAILANGNVLESILKGRVVEMYEEDEDLLETIINENKQTLDMTVTYSTILSNTLDAYASVVSNNLNVVMKLLTSLTIVLSIPAIVSSFYGMNIGLPLQADPIAFLYILLVSFFISVSVALMFLKKGWL